MRIAFLVDKLNIDAGGSNRSLDLLSRKLYYQGHQVTIITTNITDKNRLPNSRPYEVLESEINTTTPFNIYFEVYSLLKEHESNFDIYHVFKPLLISIAGNYRRRKGKTPVVGRLNSYSMFCTNSTLMNGSCHKDCSMINKIAHDDVSKKKKFLRIPYYFYNNNFSVENATAVDRLFAQSPSIREIYSEVGVNSDIIKVIPNFYDSSFTSEDIKSFNQRDIDLLFVGRLEYGKGADILLKSITKIDPKMNVHIVGDGKYREKLEESYSRENIQFRGWIPHSQLQNIYNNSKYFVHPGRWPDPCPRTVLEAMQNKCVPIVSDMGGPPWMVGNAGKIFKSENIEDLSRIIEETVRNESKYNSMSDEIDEELQRFSQKHIISEIESEYSLLVKE